MNDKEFNTLADTSLTQIESGLEASGADLIFNAQQTAFLKWNLPTTAKLLSTATASPRKSGSQHVAAVSISAMTDLPGDDTRDGEELFAKLSRLLSEQAGENVQITA